MNNHLLIFIDYFFGFFLIPIGLILHFIIKFLRNFLGLKSNGILIIKLLGAGNYLSIRPEINNEVFDIVTVASNNLSITYFDVGNNIYEINDKNLLSLFISSIKVFFILITKSYDQVINLEMESNFAKFLALISPTKILSGLSSNNKSYLDRIIYDSYLVSPLLMGRSEIVRQLLEFNPKVNKYFSLIINNHQKKFKKKFPSFKSLENIAIFPSCSSTDSLRRVKNDDWKIILTKLNNSKHVEKITVIFSAESDEQYSFFLYLLDTMNSKKISLKITKFNEFVDWIKRSDLILSVDSQALHIAQFYKKKTIAFYGPTSPFGFTLQATTYPIYLSLSCSPCTHKYLKLPCGNFAPCRNFTRKHLEIFNF